MSNKSHDTVTRTHVQLPASMIAEIDELVGPRKRSHFLTQAANDALRRFRLIQTLEDSAGAWKDGDHPELQAGPEEYVRKLRGENEKRFKELFGI